MGEEGSSKLMIKLKIPSKMVVEKYDDDDLEEGEIREEADEEVGSKEKELNPNPITNKENIRVCPECSKEFSSGKALGGHMRVHAQKNQLKVTKSTCYKKSAPEKSEQQQRSYMSRCTDENGRPVCKICGKNFPSIKSLCGHLRCHPEREWRGILPPDDALLVHNSNINNDHSSSSSSSFSASSSSDDDDSSPICSGDYSAGFDGKDHSLIDVLQTSWNLKRKRSGGQVGEKSSEVGISSKEEEVKLLDAAEELMRLSYGDQLCNESGSSQKRQKVDEFEATNSNSLTNKDDLGLNKGEVEKSLSNSTELSDNNELLMTVNSNSVSGTPDNMSKKKKRKTKMMMDVESGLDISPNHQPTSQDNQKPAGEGETTPDKYKCSTCNKSFSTHQALGGHRSSHNKFKINIVNAVEDKVDHDEDNGRNNDVVKLDETAKESGGASGSSSIHQCTICDKVFPTGQALGGHKRCHWTGPVSDQAGAQSSEASEGRALAGHKTCEAASDQADPKSSQLISHSPEETSRGQALGVHKTCQSTGASSPKKANQGQALGVHKICLWTEAASDQAGPKSSQLTSSSPEEASHTVALNPSTNVVDFDLNEVPAMEDEGGDNSIGNSSSSYNSNIGYFNFLHNK